MAADGVCPRPADGTFTMEGAWLIQLTVYSHLTKTPLKYDSAANLRPGDGKENSENVMHNDILIAQPEHCDNYIKILSLHSMSQQH